MKFARTVTVAAVTCLTGLVYLSAANFVPVRANDSSAAIAAGGLELIKNNQVRMVSETLRIAPRKIEIDYIFENTSSSDVTTEVAFPLPDMEQAAVYYSPLNIPFAQDTNFVGFQLWIDGKEIKPNVEVRAFVKDVEITSELRRLKIDLVNPRIDCPGCLSPEAAEALQRLDAIHRDRIDKDRYDTVATWTTKVSFHWSQTFQPGKRIAIRHRYRPLYGNYFVQNDKPQAKIKKDDQRSGGQWCFDSSFNAAQERLFDRQYQAAANQRSDASSDTRVNYENVQYVLKTGANWQGPIGRFELQIEKGGADLVSTCPIEGLELQRAPYGFNAVASNYTPTGNLDILFVSGQWLGPANGLGPPAR